MQTFMKWNEMKKRQKTTTTLRKMSSRFVSDSLRNSMITHTCIYTHTLTGYLNGKKHCEKNAKTTHT